MGKIEGVRQQLTDLNIDSLFVSTEENIRYLTNFTGSSGAVLISKSDAIFFTDFRYAKQSEEQVNEYDIEVCGASNSLLDTVIQKVNDLGIQKLGFESSYLTYEVYHQLKQSLEVELFPTVKIIEALREVKSDREIELLRTAAQISDHAFDQILDYIRPGVTEKDVANELEYLMRKEGATSSSSPTMIVASGVRSALPHGAASDKVIEQGDMVTLDYGALYEGYRSDMTRTISIGEPSDKFKGIYNIVLEALLHCKKHIKANISAKEVDALVRNHITEQGYGEYFGHGSGHGIGLMIHEDPFFSTTSNQILKEGSVVTIEPGIYLPDFGGVRIEDDVVVKSEGIEVITKSPKELIIL